MRRKERWRAEGWGSEEGLRVKRREEGLEGGMESGERKRKIGKMER